MSTNRAKARTAPRAASAAAPAWLLDPVPLSDVRITGGFWAERQEVNRTRTIPHILAQCEKTGRIQALRGWKTGQGPTPHIFWDSDVAKWIEAASYSLATHPDESLRRQVDDLVELLERAQQPDGYLNTHFSQVEPDKRFTNLRDQHELYCAGHLIEAAVAHASATGSTRFLDVMRRYADLIDRTFGPEPGKKRGYPGHEEIELALVKLARATGERRYLRLAEYFVLERGRAPSYFAQEAEARGEPPHPSWTGGSYAYYQAHRPVLEQETAEGHAVRAMYLYSAMADLAAETGNTALLAVCRKLWRNVTGRRMYVTGGVGSSAHGERFTTDYDLPNETAYAETCAAIGLVLWAHRMLAIEADGAYADVMERALYNGALAGLSLDGESFYYVNRLAAYPDLAPASSLARQSWFDCACCPPNIARLIASVGRTLYGQGAQRIALHHYASSQASFTIGGQRVEVAQSTDYPWGGRVELVLHLERAARFALELRIPGWCLKAKLRVAGRPVDVAPALRRGYARISRSWSDGDRIELDLAMPARSEWCTPRVRPNAGRVALFRGPLLFCLEERDNGAELDALILPRTARIEAARLRWLAGAIGLETHGFRERSRDWRDDLYRSSPGESREAPVRAVPYYAWCNRGVGEMLVWVRSK